MYMLEETVNVGLGAQTLSADPSGWSWRSDLGDGVKCFWYICIRRSLENPWILAARCWRFAKSVPGINYYQVGMRDQELHMLRSPPLRWYFLMQQINNCWYFWCSQLKGVGRGSHPRGLVVIWNMEGGLKSFWIDCWKRIWNKGR